MVVDHAGESLAPECGISAEVAADPMFSQDGFSDAGGGGGRDFDEGDFDGGGFDGGDFGDW